MNLVCDEFDIADIVGFGGVMELVPEKIYKFYTPTVDTLYKPDTVNLDTS